MQKIKQFYHWLRKKDKTYKEQFIEFFGVLLPALILIRTFGFGLYLVPTGSMETTMLVGDRFFADKLTILWNPPHRGDIVSLNDPEYRYSDNKLVRLWEMYLSWKLVNWTKRVIGEPGDHVQGLMENGKTVVYVNGVKLDEPYLNKYPLITVHGPTAERRYIQKTWDPSKPLDQQPFYYMRPQDIARDSYGHPVIRYPGTPCEDQISAFSIHNRDVFDVHLGPDEYWLMGDNRQGSKDSRWFGPVKKELIHGRIVFRLISIDSDSQWLPLDLLNLILHPIEFGKRVRWSRFLQPVR